MSVYKGGTRFLLNCVSDILKLRIRFLMFHTFKEAGRVCQQMSNQIFFKSIDKIFEAINYLLSKETFHRFDFVPNIYPVQSFRL